MTSIGRTKVGPGDFAATLAGLKKEFEAHSAALESTEQRLTQKLESLPPSQLKHAWLAARAAKRGVEDAFQELLERVDPVSLRTLKLDIERNRRLASAVRSLTNLCESVARLNRAPEEEEIVPGIARHQHSLRQDVLDRIDTVRDMLKAAGPCEATGRFPVQQLAEIEARAKRDVEALRRARDEVLQDFHPRTTLRAAEIATVEAAAQAIGDLLGNDALRRSLVASGERLEHGREEFRKNLAAFAVVIDCALAAPDYATTGLGGYYPESRLSARAREYDGWDMYAAEARHGRARDLLEEAAVRIAEAEHPDRALEGALIAAFLGEIGVGSRKAKDWNITPQTVREAIEREALLPLRALNEMVDDIVFVAHVPEHEAELRRVIEDITRHVVEGDFRDWRSGTERSRKQLSVLAPEQREKWGSNLSVSSPAIGRGELRTREEDGPELMWVTKIGGPSHGFDVGPHCLLPLLANARTRPILVDDPAWPHNAAARCYLRLLSYEDGSPVLYLEPLQRDFPHRRTFKGLNEDAAFRIAQVKHALAKADALGVPLSVPAFDDFALQYLNRRFRREEAPLVVAASAGIFEASDTLGLGHDFVNTESLTTPPLFRLRVDPQNAPGEGGT